MRILFSAALLVTLLGGGKSGSFLNGDLGSRYPVALDEVLRWFPETTETVIATNGPFRVPPFNPDAGPPGFAGHFEMMSLGPLLSLRNGAYHRQLAGQTVLFSMEASMRFRSPKALGSMPYDGCHVTFFQQDFADLKGPLTKSLQAGADLTHDIGGHKVMLFEEKLEGDTWKICVSLLEENAILYATDESLMRRTLSRIDSRAERQALPESLPEWKYVDKEARVWAIRHYDKGNATNDPSSPLSGQKAPYSVPDAQAIGLVVTLDPSRLESLRVKYLSSNPDALALARPYWEPQGYAKPRISMFDEGLVEISSAERGSGPFILLVLGALGHGLYI
jgi:hypothetical protein